jgi:hypothetical protein
LKDGEFMTTIIYTDIKALSKTQIKIMKIVDGWVHCQKTAIPRSEIVGQLKKQNVGEPTTVNALNGLLEKHYLQRAVIISNKTYYVKLRGV